MTAIEAFEPGWQSAAPEPDPELEAWIDARSTIDPRPISAVDDTDRPTLEAPELRRLVLARHPAIAAAESELQRAKAHLAASGAWPNPELELRTLIQGEAEGEIEASLALALPISGRIAAARHAGRVELDIAEQALEVARHEALLELDLLLAQLAHARHRLALTAEISEGSQQLASLVQQRQTAALADPLDVTIVLADAARDAGSLARAQASVTALEGRITSLVGLEPGRATLHPPSLEHAHLAEGRQALLDAAANTRPEWVLARLELERSEWAVREASRARIPEPTLGPAVVGDPQAPSLGLRFGLPIPILAPGGAPYREARAERDAAYQRLVAVSRETPARIDALLAELEGLESALHAVAGASLGSARQAATLAQDRYAAGQIDVLHLQSARRAWVGIESETLDILLDIQRTQLEVERAIGRPLAFTDPDQASP